MGLTSLTRTEQVTVEKEIIRLYKKQFDSNVSVAPSSTSQVVNEKAPAKNNMHKAWAGFLQSTNTQVTTGNPLARSIHDDLKRYRDLATKL